MLSLGLGDAANDAALEARNAAWRAADAAKSPAASLTVSDYLASGDSLSNWPAGATPSDLIAWYIGHMQVIWQAPDGKRTTELPAGAAAQGYIRTADGVLTVPNGKEIVLLGQSQMEDPFGVGPTAIGGSRAAKIYKQTWIDAGGVEGSKTPGAPGNFYGSAGSVPAAAHVNYPNSALTTVNSGLQTQQMVNPASPANLPAGSTANDVAAASGLSTSTTAASDAIAAAAAGWDTKTWLLIAAAAAAGLYMFSSKEAGK